MDAAFFVILFYICPGNVYRFFTKKAAAVAVRFAVSPFFQVWLFMFHGAETAVYGHFQRTSPPIPGRCLFFQDVCMVAETFLKRRAGNDLFQNTLTKHQQR